MTQGKNKGAIWVSLVGGLLAGAIAKPIVLPSGFSDLHGMGVPGDVALAGICLGLAYVTYRLLCSGSRTTTPHSASVSK